MKVNSVYSYAYAKAVFSLAVQQNKLAEWEKFLNYFMAITQYEAIATYCQTPWQYCSISTSLKQLPLDLLTVLLQDLQVSLTPEMINFIQLLLLRKRLELLPHINKIYQEMFAEYSKTLKVKIATVEKLTDGDKQKLINNLAQHYGCMIELEQEIAAELIGGAILYIKDKVVDGSVAGQLRRLRTCL